MCDDKRKQTNQQQNGPLPVVGISTTSKLGLKLLRRPFQRTLFTANLYKILSRKRIICDIQVGHGTRKNYDLFKIGLSNNVMCIGRSLIFFIFFSYECSCHEVTEEKPLLKICARYEKNLA